MLQRPAARFGAQGAAALGVIAGCNAMIQLDDPIVNIALPGLREALGLSAMGAAWVINAYLLTFGGLLLLGGRAGDILGRRRVFMAGVALFTAAAALRGLAQSAEFLIAVRAVQGVGAALAAPSGLALLLSTFTEGAARKRAIAVCTMVGAVCTAGGLLLAGTLTSLSSWRWVLYLDVPLGLAIVLLAPIRARRDPPPPRPFQPARRAAVRAGCRPARLRAGAGRRAGRERPGGRRLCAGRGPDAGGVRGRRAACAAADRGAAAVRRP
ncbi:MFS transporter [Streptomyces sp. NBC_00076]|uniref:MFS transporter n=1 Tax=Streptomyces sp. NBC_00076 TaxID=2975642 RepID=UPI00324955B1